MYLKVANNFVKLLEKKITKSYSWLFEAKLTNFFQQVYCISYRLIKFYDLYLSKNHLAYHNKCYTFV